LLEFLGGCLVAELWMRQPGGFIRNLTSGLAGIALLVAFGTKVDAADMWSRTLGFGLPAMLIVSAAAGLGRHVPRVTALERLGDASYSIYLFHMFIVTLMFEAWRLLPELHTPINAIVFVVIALVLASWAGLQVFKWVELPSQKWLAWQCLIRPRGLDVADR